MINGYLISFIKPYWRLSCDGKLLPEEYETREEAEIAATNKSRCAPPEKPKQKNTPITNPDSKRKTKYKIG